METLKEKEMLRTALAGTWGRMLVPFTMGGKPRGGQFSITVVTDHKCV